MTGVGIAIGSAMALASGWPADEASLWNPAVRSGDVRVSRCWTRSGRIGRRGDPGVARSAPRSSVDTARRLTTARPRQAAVWAEQNLAFRSSARQPTSPAVAVPGSPFEQWSYGHGTGRERRLNTSKPFASLEWMSTELLVICRILPPPGIGGTSVQLPRASTLRHSPAPGPSSWSSRIQTVPSTSRAPREKNGRRSSLEWRLRACRARTVRSVTPPLLDAFCSESRASRVTGALFRSSDTVRLPSSVVPRHSSTLVSPNAMSRLSPQIPIEAVLGSGELMTNSPAPAPSTNTLRSGTLPMSRAPFTAVSTTTSDVESVEIPVLRARGSGMVSRRNTRLPIPSLPTNFADGGTRACNCWVLTTSPDTDRTVSLESLPS